jgi:nucleoside-diphosphate-sugar epimerase
MTEKVLIIGCGWLGQHIAPVLAAAGYQIFGSRRTQAAAEALPAPIQGFMQDFQPPWSAAQLALFQDAWVICTIPPGGRQGGVSDYPQVLRQLALLCQTAGIRGGIHISSTGIYQGLSGEVNEQAELQLTAPRVALLAAGEQALQQQGSWLTLRLSGLMGPGRHPGRFAQGRVLNGAAQPVNMVHSADVAAAVLQTLSRWPLPRACYNLSAPQQLTKAEFYQAAAESQGLAATCIDLSAAAAEPARQVSSQRFIDDADFSFQFADPRSALPFCD